MHAPNGEHNDGGDGGGCKAAGTVLSPVNSHAPARQLKLHHAFVLELSGPPALLLQNSGVEIQVDAGAGRAPHASDGRTVVDIVRQARTLGPKERVRVPESRL